MRYVVQLIEAVGIERIVALDDAFRCCTEHLEAVALFVRRLAHLLGAEPAVACRRRGATKVYAVATHRYHACIRAALWSS